MTKAQAIAKAHMALEDARRYRGYLAEHDYPQTRQGFTRCLYTARVHLLEAHTTPTVKLP